MKKLLLYAMLLIVNYSLNAMTTANGTKTRILKADDNRLTVCWEVDSEYEKCISFDVSDYKGVVDSWYVYRKSEGNTCLWKILHDNAKSQLKSSHENKQELSQKQAQELLAYLQR